MPGAFAGTASLRGARRASDGGPLDSWAARLDQTAVRIRLRPPRGRRLGAPAFQAANRLAAPALLAAAAVLVQLIPGAAGLFEYDRSAILDGQLWRLFTGHWTHLSLDHLAWDVLAFAALGGALAWRSRRLCRRIILGSAAAISAALLLIGPRWESYRGLSGIDSALFAALAATLWLENRRRSDRWLGATALILFCGKVGLEMLTGSALFTGDVPGHEIVPLAHFVGAGVGLALVLGQRRFGPRAALQAPCDPPDSARAAASRARSSVTSSQLRARASHR